MSVTVGDMVKKMREDPGLCRALADAADQDSRVAAFSEAGLAVTPEDLAHARAAIATGELSEADLERVAGGMIFTSHAGLAPPAAPMLTAFG